jgi:hypothetical protein
MLLDVKREVGEKFYKAKEVFEQDTKENLSDSDFLDILVSACQIFREKRGPSESTYLRGLK